MHVFLTGGSGFVGLNIVAELLRGGHQVSAYLRPNARKRYLDRFPVRQIVGRLTDRHVLSAALRGVDAIIHTAGNTNTSRFHLQELEATNVEGTRAVIEAARKVGVKRLVYTSSTATIGSYGKIAKRATESLPLTGFRARSPYARTKCAAERLLMQRHDVTDCVILNPAEVIGPYDHTMQWGRLVIAVSTEQLPFVPPGGGSFCPAQAVAEAHVAALERGRHGTRYILGGHDVSFARLLNIIAQEVGRPAKPTSKLPYAVQRWLAKGQESLATFGARGPAVDSFRMRVFAGHHYFDDSLARRELGYAPSSLERAVVDCVAWYRSNGFLAEQSGEKGYYCD
jgi:dihydroflavonol-4-reductase